MALGGGISSGGVTAGEGCYHLRGSDRGHWPANVGPGIGLGGTRQTGWGALPGGWAKLAIHGCGSLATCSGGYLATPPTLAS